jgi:hypothetical protein
MFLILFQIDTIHMTTQKLTLPYFISLIVLLLSGLIWVFSAYQPNTFRMIGLLLAVSVCAIVNLTYFLSAFKNGIRLIVPGVICTLVFLWVNRHSSVEKLFFLFFGLVNLAIGCSWWLFLSIRNPKK